MPLDAIIGHAETLRRLVDAAERGRLAQAYLFQGLSGVGKRLAARALFAALHCPERAGDFCGECPICRRVMGGEHPDVHELPPDERGVIKIDAVRELQHRLAYQPFEGHWKLGIIDEAHRMNTAAANALLKTLEEPPAATTLVLVSQAPAALPATILSRVQRVSFRALRPEEIERLLAADPELDEPARRTLALHGEGSVGRCLGPGRERILRERPAVIEAFLSICSATPVRLTELASTAGQERAGTDALAAWSRSFLHDVALTQAGRPERVRNVDFRDAVDRVAQASETHDVIAAFDRIARVARAQDVNVNRRLALEVLLRELSWVGDAATGES
ncbi:MAG: DNA polymerase III subunit delta' [Myxococcales bacterium]|nr:DNA polymerase III subunit delta' [Myxococcales bacterium]